MIGYIFLIVLPNIILGLTMLILTQKGKIVKHSNIIDIVGIAQIVTAVAFPLILLITIVEYGRAEGGLTTLIYMVLGVFMFIVDAIILLLNRFSNEQ